MKPSSALRILVTGGTFDKEYDELAGRLFFRDTHVPEMLRLGRNETQVSIQSLMMIDSLEMTDDRRAQVLKACVDAPEARIVITHGTDTMENTARALGESGQLSAKTVVLTGAMVPYLFGNSDGLFNLGSALAFAQLLPAGVYVAMNGRYLPWDRVTKDRSTGKFVERL